MDSNPIKICLCEDSTNKDFCAKIGQLIYKKIVTTCKSADGVIVIKGVGHFKDQAEIISL